MIETSNNTPERIARSVALKAAVDFCNTNNSPVTVEEVAKRFERYILWGHFE